MSRCRQMRFHRCLLFERLTSAGMRLLQEIVQSVLNVMPNLSPRAVRIDDEDDKDEDDGDGDGDNEDGDNVATTLVKMMIEIATFMW
eukprot:768188-Hanusia_phi.AAC.9